MNNLVSQSGVNICLYEHVNFFHSVVFFHFFFNKTKTRIQTFDDRVYNADRRTKRYCLGTELMKLLFKTVKGVGIMGVLFMNPV